MNLSSITLDALLDHPQCSGGKKFYHPYLIHKNDERDIQG